MAVGRETSPGSPDLEDVIAVIDGRAEIVGEVQRAATDVRRYIAREFTSLLGKRAFIDALPWLLLPDSASQARQPLIVDRLKAIAGLSE